MSTGQMYVGKVNCVPLSDQTAEKATLAVESEPLTIWKAFPGLEHLYQISNYGNVRSLATQQPVRTRMSKGFEVLAVGRKVNGKLYRPAIHRAVALAFVPNPNNYGWAKAIDPNKPLTHASNLQWVPKYFAFRTNQGNRSDSLAWSRLTPLPKGESVPVNQAYSKYIIDRLAAEGRLSQHERSRAGIVACEDDSMSPQLSPGIEFVATPVNPAYYHTLIGKVVAVVVKAKRFAFYLGRVVSITDNEVTVRRDNSQWSERIESRSVIQSIARVVSVLETSVN